MFSPGPTRSNPFFPFQERETGFPAERSGDAETRSPGGSPPLLTFPHEWTAGPQVPPWESGSPARTCHGLEPTHLPGRTGGPAAYRKPGGSGAGELTACASLGAAGPALPSRRRRRNPYPVPFSAEVRGPNGTRFILPEFYRGEGEWVIRGSPDQVGEWTVTTRSDQPGGDGSPFLRVNCGRGVPHGVPRS
ncbi:MAG: DUF5060 domain-containing protein [SAR202 cluster bacterium]|nr:DUF5060 domain-containing protein [SAR202 cluster bacterium]